MPVRSCVIDRELIAADVNGEADFLALLRGGHAPICVYAFDLMEPQGHDLRNRPLVERRAKLKALLARGKGDLIRFSEDFPDADALQVECARRGRVVSRT